MREIKFRAWDGQTLWPGWELEDLLYRADGGAVPITEEHWDGETIWADRVEWEQFIGLYDRNGTEIYEGDIVRSPYRDFAGVIRIGEANYMGVGVRLTGVIFEQLKPSPKVELWMYNSGPYDWVVIGNIHESSELLQ